tara:strand:+ start:416 stop:592 length:177 start_codon:yes stop_codon:yes gene_type:complete
MAIEDTKPDEDKAPPFSFAPNEAQKQLKFTLQSLINMYGKKRVLKILKTLQITSIVPE